MAEETTTLPLDAETFRMLLDSLPRLPERYEDNYIRLQAVDPYGVQVWWDFADMVEQALRERIPPPQLKVLRIYDVTGHSGTESSLSWDIPVDPLGHGLAIETGQPGREFIVSLGYVGGDNRFHELGQSGRVRTPPVSADSHVAQRFVQLDLARSIEEQRAAGRLPDPEEPGVLDDPSRWPGRVPDDIRPLEASTSPVLTEFMGRPHAAPKPHSAPASSQEKNTRSPWENLMRWRRKGPA